MVINPDGTVQFEGDTQKLFTGGGARAALPGQTDLATANRAARVAKYGSDAVTKMEQAGGTFGGGSPTAPSIPTPTNAAPVATSAAAQNLTFGERALRALRIGGSALIRGGGVAQAGAGVLDAAKNGVNVDNAEDVGLGAVTAIAPPVGVAGNVAKFFRDTIMRGVVNHFIPEQNPNLYTPKLSDIVKNGGAAAARAPSAGALPASANGVPALGTGTATNNQTGHVMNFNTGIPPSAAPGATQPAESTSSAATAFPTLGTRGGIFGNLQRFSKELAVQKGAAAANAQGFNRYLKVGALGAKQQEAEARGTAAYGTLLRGTAAMANAGETGKKVTTDLMGNPVIVDTRNSTALSPAVKKPVAEADILATMKANNMSREAVMTRLRAEGRM